MWGLCFQTRHSLSPPAQCANSIQKHMSLLSEPPPCSLSCLLCLGRSQSALGWPRRSRAPHFVPDTLPRVCLLLRCPPKPANIPEHISSELCRHMFRVCRALWGAGTKARRAALQGDELRARSVLAASAPGALSPQGYPNPALVWSGPQGDI